MRIRDATPHDWPSIWPFFAAVCKAGETYAYPHEPTIDEGRALWMQSPPAQTLVAVDAEDRVLGTANVGPNRMGPGAHVATGSFMVAPEAAGKGVGRALADATLAWARERDFKAMQFNAVVETNAAAVHLWKAVGFEVIGTVPEAFDHPVHGLVGLHVMWQRL